MELEDRAFFPLPEDIALEGVAVVETDVVVQVGS